MTHDDQRKYLNEAIKLAQLDDGTDVVFTIFFDLLVEIAENTKK